MNKVIDMLPLMKEEYKGGTYSKEKPCQCGCGREKHEILDPCFYDYENNLEDIESC